MDLSRYINSDMLFPFIFSLLDKVWRSTVSAMGTTTLAFLVAFFVVPLVLLFVEWAKAKFTREGWLSAINKQKSSLWVSAVTLAAWLCIFGYQLLVGVPRNINSAASRVSLPVVKILRIPRPPAFAYVKTPPLNRRFTTAELARFGTGIAVAIARESQPSPTSAPIQRTVATGFWVSPGNIATCLRPIVAAQGVPRVGVPLPPLLGKHLLVAGGAMYTSGEMLGQDEAINLSIVHVLNNPFQRRMHMFALWKGPKTGEAESDQERYWVPGIVNTLPKAGDRIVRIGFTSDSLPNVTSEFGYVTRIGIDETARSESFRIFTSLPFDKIDCGAPIINDDEQVVGLVVGVDPHSTFAEPREVAIPASYIVKLRKQLKANSPH